MFQRILVPIDGSPTSAAGLRQAIALAEDQGATLYLLHVVDELVVTQGFDGTAFAVQSEIDAVINALRRQGKRLLDKAAEAANRRSVKYETLLVDTFGHAVADVIAEQAKKRRVGLIVMGTHGRRGITRLVMGSDAEGVVRSARVPVMLVRLHKETSRARAKKS
jgi:nucleotide-binding universal stress UspA family protein